MGRGSTHAFDHWHHRELVLEDGDRLTWLVVDSPAPPWADAFRLASRGAITSEQGVELFRGAGHPDADLTTR